MGLQLVVQVVAAEKKIPRSAAICPSAEQQCGPLVPNAACGLYLSGIFPLKRWLENDGGLQMEGWPIL